MIHTGDCIQVMPTMQDSSVDLILTDPPYFKVKPDSWDRQWKKADEFLAWLDQCAEQWQRLMKPNGSLYCFASPQMAARVEIMLSKRFRVLNHIVWNKPEGRHRQACKGALRRFFPQTERIIFCEHYGADNSAKGEAGYAAACDELRGFIFEPIRAYICSEYQRAGMLNTQGKIATNVACGFSASSGGMASRHYFGQSQWQLPTAEHYESMQGLLNRTGGDYLRREYDDLRREYDDLRRPFSVSREVQYTDSWTFDTVKPYKGKHPCEKPQPLLEHIISSSSKPGALVLDSFAGTGSTGVACKKLGRDFVGIELSEKYAEISRQRTV